MATFYTVDEVARACKVARKTLLYHHEWRGLVEPERVGTRRFYSQEDRDRIVNYFSNRKRWQRAEEVTH